MFAKKLPGKPPGQLKADKSMTVFVDEYTVHVESGDRSTSVYTDPVNGDIFIYAFYEAFPLFMSKWKGEEKDWILISAVKVPLEGGWYEIILEDYS